MIIHWLQQSETGQQVMQSLIVNSSGGISPDTAANKRQRRVRFSAQDDVKILQASQRFKPNKVPRKQRKQSKRNHEEEMETVDTPSTAVQSSSNSTYNTNTAATMKTTDVSTVTNIQQQLPKWNESSLRLLRSALNLKRHHHSNKSVSSIINTTKLNKNKKTQDISSLETTSNKQQIMETTNESTTTFQANSTLSQSVDDCGDEYPMGEGSSSSNIELVDSTCENASSRNAAVVVLPADVPATAQKPNRMGGRTARDSLLLLTTRMDTPYSETTNKNQQQQTTTTATTSTSTSTNTLLPSLEECPSDEQLQQEQQVFDDNDAWSVDFNENRTENDHHAVVPPSQGSWRPEETDFGKSSFLVDEKNAAGNTTTLSLSNILSPATSRPLGLSNRVIISTVAS
ncbi:hypothetical protein IV203_028159 [Nitzschia inconspicua]|uniref:Uncharacterized protein n=1 Tax=Nitzschia inconspicua TaxID=303405 RepID=A0A9K3K5U6_9STRA|nr:hypothetical protein IV203_028183 [Nitzschia inconspicua]KAG7336873.1 hypothetical protein IV203_033471 [Nitzschia inconspicua]KAG7344689.1 hypothetical protein IV203_032220 [Nitzschia inconspicua]KAG7370413.1 hypothetical protein IV203_028159 [Nitzschia inconspicua]